MMGTKISWTNETWNPTTGCSRVSEGCRHCYAEALSLRFGWSKKPWTGQNAPENLVFHEDRLDKPYSWRSPRRVFVQSMSDLFHEQIPDAFIDRVFAVMALTPQHTYQVLTKRAARMCDYMAAGTAKRHAAVEQLAWEELRARGKGPRDARQFRLVWPLENVWKGVSVEDQKNADVRLPLLLETPAAVRFVSAEPLLASVDLTRIIKAGRRIDALRGDVLTADGEIYAAAPSGLDWVIVGGESGPHMNRHPERWMKHEWARDLRNQCLASGTAYYFKQSSGVRTEMGTALEHADGTLWAWRQWPGEMTPPVYVGMAPHPGYFDGPRQER